MKKTQSALLPPALTTEMVKLGNQFSRLRLAHKVTQTDAALRAGISRNTAYRIESGDAGVAVGQLLRYMKAIAPSLTFKELINESSVELLALSAREKTRRTRSAWEILFKDGP
ncbi:helix-turn-helix domain-containing protein [Herbaspirillum camelliae]|uniref:helix-turn-helix domain-containing protein n=1 Tax=Herbaspirillum camelliae TaxID=1892903 RepID=UPI000949FB85|nr:helix-turn-helix transcriptional regulator [Herbaspirillum camelliae]